ncbi:MAG TPA: DMT family transporter [Thermotogota bacterium]|nr:DMT family transporter [Thermotogota bacterium]HRW34348.1 DMT family transporter [Thermotogota bacterium]
MKRYVYLLMVLVTMFWGGSFVIGKVTVDQFPPLTLTFFRYLISALIIFPIMIKKEGKKAILKIRDLPVMIIIAISGGFGYGILYFLALSYTTAIKAAIIVATNPLMTLLISSLLIRERLTPIKLFAVSIAMFGVMITITNGFQIGTSAFSFNPGDLIMFAAVILYSFYAVFSQKIMKRYSPFILTGYSFILSLLFMIPIAMGEKPFQIWKASTLQEKFAVIYLGTLASAVGYLLHQVSIHFIGATKTMGFYSLVPIFTALFSIIFLDEPITPALIIGGVIIIFGIYLNYGYKERKLSAESQ